MLPSTGPIEKQVEEDLAAVGITGVSSARKRNVKILALEGVKPTYDNLKGGHYQLYRPLYLVTPPHLRNPVVDNFVEFALGNEGRQILRKAGTVSYVDAMYLIKKQRQQWHDSTKHGLDRWGYKPKGR